MNGFLPTTLIPAEVINHADQFHLSHIVLQTSLSDPFFSQETISPIPSKTGALSSSTHANSIRPIHSLLPSFQNPLQIPRQFHVSTFQACNCLQSCYSYRFRIGSWNDYSMEYFRILPNSSAYVTKRFQTNSFSRGTLCFL